MSSQQRCPIEMSSDVDHCFVLRANREWQAFSGYVALRIFKYGRFGEPFPMSAPEGVVVEEKRMVVEASDVVEG